MTGDLVLFLFGVVVGAVGAGFVLGGQYLGFVTAAHKQRER